MRSSTSKAEAQRAIDAETLNSELVQLAGLVLEKLAVSQLGPDVKVNMAAARLQIIAVKEILTVTPDQVAGAFSIASQPREP